MAESEKLTQLIKESLQGIKELINCETVMGDPITTSSETTIIPVSKVSLGYGSGGLDYFSKNVVKEEKNNGNGSNFAGGGGIGLSVVPLGFLVVDKNGRAEFLSISAANNVPTAVSIINSAVDVIERTPEIAEKLKKLFAKKDDDKSDEEKNTDEENGADVSSDEK